MKYKVKISSSEVVGYTTTFFSEELVDNYVVIDESEIINQIEPLKSVLTAIYNQYLKSELIKIDESFGMRYIRDFALLNQPLVNEVTYQRLVNAEKVASKLRSKFI